MAGCAARAAPTSPPPWRTLKTPAGRPASAKMAPRLRAPRGVTSEGLKIMALPQARAGAAFQQAIWLGIVPGADAEADAERLAAGVDEVAAPAPPRSVASPERVAARAANHSRASAPEGQSATSVSEIGLPVSRVSSSARARASARMRSAARRRTRARAAGAVVDHTAKPSRRGGDGLLDGGEGRLVEAGDDLAGRGIADLERAAGGVLEGAPAIQWEAGGWAIIAPLPASGRARGRDSPRSGRWPPPARSSGRAAPRAGRRRR